MIKYLILLGLLFCSGTVFSDEATAPIQVAIGVQINKVYNVNATNETYSIDGYLVAEWLDFDAIAVVGRSQDGNSVDLQGNAIDEYEKKGLWLPNLEFINVIGNRTVPNRRVKVKNNGKVTYNERFDAVFTTHMDFKQFPFDRQTFKIEIESFSKGRKSLIFVIDPRLKTQQGNYFNSEWNTPVINESISTEPYPQSEEAEYSRHTINLTTKRVPNYYLWQFIFPLFLIILSSWSVFWIEELSSQLSTSFTLMLTVVAFNFYTTNILPRLPYTSFLDALVIVGYISIFIGILIVLARHKWIENLDRTRPILVFLYRFVIPLVVLTAVIILANNYFELTHV
jgi:hypothetical protein